MLIDNAEQCVDHACRRGHAVTFSTRPHHSPPRPRRDDIEERIRFIPVAFGRISQRRFRYHHD